MSQNITEIGNITDNLFENILTSDAFLPIPKETVRIKGIGGRHELELKTAFADPKIFFKKISQLIFECITEFYDRNDQVNFKEFIQNFTQVDIFYASLYIYDLTFDGDYEKQTIRCGACNHTFEDNITTDDLLENSQIVEFNEMIKDESGQDVSVSFKDFRYVIDKIYKIPKRKIEEQKNIIEKEGDKNRNYIESIMYRFHTCLPEIERYLTLMNFIPAYVVSDRIQNNEEIIRVPEEIGIFTKKMEIINNYVNYETGEKSTEIKSLNGENSKELESIYIELCKMNLGVDIVKKKYDEYMGKYIPSFFKKYQCPNCGEEIKRYINPFQALQARYFR